MANRSSVWKNDDGLTVRFHRDLGKAALVGDTQSDGIRIKKIVDLDYSRFGATGTDYLLDNQPQSALPSGAQILDATLIVTEAFTSGGAATLTIGLYKEDGTTAIDADGIDAAIALTAINTVGEVVDCDGALVGGVALTADGYISVNVGTAAFTAGRAVLEIEYLIPKS